MIDDYSRRKLKYESDILNAVTGLLRRVAATFSTRNDTRASYRRVGLRIAILAVGEPRWRFCGSSPPCLPELLLGRMESHHILLLRSP
jgi:hypothetical protein